MMMMVVAEMMVVEVEVEVVSEVVAEEGEEVAEVRRLVDKSAWGRASADVFGLQIFKKTNKLQEPYVCAPLRDADISAQKSF
ncbi:hypothetical protein HanIR_Chr11g0508041 [Helianthus annuus]|nr:hypothetical protein HanIR_Chr11g0508041 [Helianthus annuus]